MKSSPALLLLVLIIGAAAAIGWLRQKQTGNPGVAEAPAPNAPVNAEAASLQKQIELLQGQIEYLQGQVDVLQEENAALIQKLGSIGMKPGSGPAPAAADSGVAPDFVGMGVDMMRFRKLQALPLVTSPVSETEVEKAVLAWLRRTQPGDRARRFASTLATLGWIPEEVDPLPLQARLLTRQLGGWYDAETDTMLTVDEKSNPPPSMRPDEPLAIAYGQLLREYGPVLFQPQHGALSTDERLARESLLAGDAGLTRFLYSLQEPKASPKDQIPAEDPDHPLNQVGAPMLLREMVMFPFTRGFEFAQTLHSADGFPQLNAAYSRPPANTAEVIDPEAYLAVKELDTTPRFSDSGLQLAGADAFYTDQLGRFLCVSVLRMHNEDENAALAASGLLADRVLAWDAGAGAKRHHAAWQTVFRDADGATAFLMAMGNVLNERHGRPTTPEPAERLEFEAQGRFILLRRDRSGEAVLLLDTASAAARAALEKNLLSGPQAAR